MDVIKSSPRLQRWPTVVILALVFILGAVIVVRKLGLLSFGIRPATFLSIAYSEDVFAHHPLPRYTRYGAHNFRQLNRVITEYDRDVAARLATLVERRATAADPDLIRLIVDMLDPPSTHMVKMSRQLVSTPQSDEVDEILKQKVNTRNRLTYRITLCNSRCKLVFSHEIKILQLNSFNYGPFVMMWKINSSSSSSPFMVRFFDDFID